MSISYVSELTYFYSDKLIIKKINQVNFIITVFSVVKTVIFKLKGIKMENLNNSNRSWLQTTLMGIIISIITAIVMIVLTKTGISPFPKPPSLAFAETIIGHQLPMPVGLLFHTVYVTFWSTIFLRMFSNRNLKTALLLALVLWIVVLTVFFPIVGWGIFGSAISPKLIPASFMPHLLFGLLLWLINKYTFIKATVK